MDIFNITIIIQYLYSKIIRLWSIICLNISRSPQYEDSTAFLDFNVVIIWRSSPRISTDNRNKYWVLIIRGRVSETAWMLLFRIKTKTLKTLSTVYCPIWSFFSHTRGSSASDFDFYRVAIANILRLRSLHLKISSDNDAFCRQSLRLLQAQYVQCM